MKPAVQRYVIGVDVGSQGMKTVLMDASGTVAASAYAAYDAHYPAPNWAEENPDPAWWANWFRAEALPLAAGEAGRAPEVPGPWLDRLLDNPAPSAAEVRALAAYVCWAARQPSPPAAFMQRLIPVTLPSLVLIV